MSRSKRQSSGRKRHSRPGEEAGWRAWWDRQAMPVKHGVCLALLLVLSLSFFAPIHFTGQSLVGSDTIQWRAMAEWMISYEAETGEQALWAPNAFGGMPGYMIHYANQIPQIDELPRLLREFLWPTSHMFFLLAGTYLLVVFLTGSLWGGMLAACAFGLTTYLPIILAVGHNTKFIALAFAPWMALAFAYALRRPRLLAALFFAAALAINLRAGHVQITYYLSFLLGLWWIVEGIVALRTGRMAVFGKATAWLALGSVLGLLMVAQPYLVHAEYKAHTIRGGGTEGQPQGLDLDYAMRWSQGPGELLTLVVADAYGGSSREGTYWGPKPFTEGPHYLGGIVFLLAGLALWQVRRRVVWAFGVGIFLMILFSLGRHFPALNEAMFHYFPLFDSFRVPETWLSIVAFALAVLGGFGLAWIGRSRPPEQEAQATRAIYIAAGTAVGLALILWLFGGVAMDFQKVGERQELEQAIAQQRPDLSPEDPQVRAFIDEELSSRRAERADVFYRDTRRTLLFLLLAGALLVFYRRGGLPAWALQAALVLLVVVDLWGVDRRYLNEDHLVYARNIEAQIPKYGFDRFLEERRAEAGGPGHFRVLSFERGDPMTTARPSYYHESIGGYHGAKLRRYQDFIDHIFRDPQSGLPNLEAIDLLNTRYIIAPSELPGTEVAYEDEETGYLVLENPDALPRGFFVGETEVVEQPEATWERLRSETFDLRQTAILPEALGIETTPLAEGETSVELTRHTPREIVWQLETDAPRLFVASEIYYPEGWHALLDGEEVPIHRVNYLLRGVQVPEGTHELTMRFDPRSHTAGVWISGLSTVLVYGAIVALLGMSYRRRRQAADQQEGAAQVETG